MPIDYATNVTNDYEVGLTNPSGDQILLGPGTDFIVVDNDLGYPDVRSDDVNRPRDNGLFVTRDYFGGRSGSLSVIARGDTAAETAANRDTLLGFWSAVSANFVLLDYKLPGQAARRIYARPRAGSATTQRIVGSRSDLMLGWTSPYPAIFDAFASTADLDLPSTAGGRSYDRTYDLSYGTVGTGGSAILVNSGTFESWPTISITGPVTNPRIENITSDEYLLVSLTVNSGETLEIDFDARTIMLNGMASRYSYLSSGSTWWRLAPGANEIHYRAAAHTASICTITFRSAWL